MRKPKFQEQNQNSICFETKTTNKQTNKQNVNQGCGLRKIQELFIYTMTNFFGVIYLHDDKFWIFHLVKVPINHLIHFENLSN